MIRGLYENGLAVVIIAFLVGGSFIPMIHGDILANENNIIIEIDRIENKILIVDDIIGERYVKYWEHVIDDFFIKNDFILLHIDVENGDILKYEKCWTDIELAISDYDEIVFEPEDYLWKKLVVFPDEEDQTFFYTFYESQEYPAVCWEVRHDDGTIILYDIDRNEIGCGIPAPFNGFSMSGFHTPSYPDPWLDWRLNANSWYSKWCDSTVSMSFPNPDVISSYISNPEYELFFEIAHGGSTYFQATETEWYYASDVTVAISDRQPMRFAFIGSCGGMDDTGPGTWSHEFRKGEMTETVTVGYSGMGSCPGWSVSLEWQDYMFYVMDAGYIIKEAFDLASAEYPTIAPCVVFVGDPNLKIREEEEDDGEIGLSPYLLITYPSEGAFVHDTITITGKADDLDGKVEHVYLQVEEGGDWREAHGTNSWELTWDTTTVEDGLHTIIAVAVDNDGLQSGCDYLTVNVSNQPLETNIIAPYNASTNEEITFQASTTGGVPPYNFTWDFNDGIKTHATNPLHIYDKPGEYHVTLTVIDYINNTAHDTTSISIIETDDVPPIVTIIKPENGLYINNNKIRDFFSPVVIGDIDITINALDSSSGLSYVELYVDGKQKNNFTHGPFVWMWNERTFGEYEVKAVACDNSGNSASDTVTVWKFF